MEVEQIESPEVEQLSVILSESGLELTETEQIKQSYLPFFIELSKIKEEAKKINWENPTPIDEKIARECRLLTVKVRTGSEDVKDSRKKIYTLKGNLEQSSWNLLRDGCKLDEERYAQVEKAREIKAANERAAKKTARMSELQPYADFVPMGIDLGNMSDEDYGKLKAGAIAQAEAKKAADIEAEKQRIAAEKAKAEEDARIRAENERLQKEKEVAEAKAKKEREALEKKLAAEKAKADAEKKKVADRNDQLRPYIVYIRDYNSLLYLKEDEYQKELAILRKEAKVHMEFEAKEAQRKAAEEEAIRIKREKEAHEKAVEELRAKAKREAEQKAADEQKARIAAEKKAAKAPDKVKLTQWVNGGLSSGMPLMSISDEAKEVATNILNKYHAFQKWAAEQIEQL